MPTGMPSRRRLGLVAQPLRQQHERPGAEPSTFVSMHRRLDRRGERVARLLQKLVGRRTFSCLHPDPLRGTDHQEHSESFGRRIDAERFLTDQEGRKARGEWIDPKLGEESLASYYGRWSDRAQATGKPSERTLIAYAEIWHRVIGPARGAGPGFTHSDRLSGRRGQGFLAMAGDGRPKGALERPRLGHTG